MRKSKKRLSVKRGRRRGAAHGSAKPHGQPDGIFTISIDDGYVEYSYDMDIGSHHSISIVEKKIRRALRCKKVDGKIRKTVSPNAPHEPRGANDQQL